MNFEPTKFKRVKMAEDGTEMVGKGLDKDTKSHFDAAHKHSDNAILEKVDDQNTGTESQTFQEDKKYNNQDLNLSKSVPYSGEVEDEHQIRILSQGNNNQTQSTKNEKFDVSDFSFFDTPVQKQTHSEVRNIIFDNVITLNTDATIESNKIDCDQEKPSEEEAVIGTLSTVVDKDKKITDESKESMHATEMTHGSKKEGVEEASDKTIDDLQDVTKPTNSENMAQTSIENTITEVQPSVKLRKTKTEETDTDMKNQDISSPNMKKQVNGDSLQITSELYPFESSKHATDYKSPIALKVEELKTEVAGSLKEDTIPKDKIIEENKSKLTSRTSNYEEDFESEEEDFDSKVKVDEMEKSTKLKIYNNDTDGQDMNEIRRQFETKSPPEDKDEKNQYQGEVIDTSSGDKEKTLLVEELSDSEIFSREKSKASIPRLQKLTQKDQSEFQQWVLIDSNKMTTNQPLTDGKTMCPETTIIDTKEAIKFPTLDGQSNSTQRIISNPEHNSHVPTKNINPYFTGRLPSLGVDDEHRDSKEHENLKNKDERHIKEDTTLPDTLNNNTADPETMSENRSTSRILELIQEINAPAQRFHISKERPLTPKTPSDKRALHQNDEVFLTTTERSKTPSDKQATHQNNETFLTRTKFCETEHDERNDKTYGVETTKMTMGDVDLLTTSMINEYVRREAPASAKFDSFPHITEITEYKKVNKLAEASTERKCENECQSTERHSEIPTLHQQSRVKQTHSRDESEKQTTESSTVIENHYQESTIQSAENVLHQNKRSSSENELKAVVASAKRAYGQDTTASSSSYQLTRETTTESDIATTKQDKDESMTSLQTSRVTDDSSHVLICSNCLNQDSDIELAGFCKECQQYLCGNCISLHKRSSYTKKHEILVAYCVKELEVKQYVKATGYCVDCQHFLCMKCVICHSGYRANRHHRIIQRTFLSKPSKKPNRASRTEVHVSFEQNTKAEKNDKSQQDTKKLQTRKKLLKDIDQGNPYRVNFVNVPQSLYPGPNKKLIMSYADNPKWPQASVPKMPYLVKPKSLQERLLQTPYVRHRKSALYTDTKSAFDPQRIKLKMLQDQFGSKSGINRRTGRRKEEGLFTARRERKSDVTSLPDINTKPKKAHAQKIEKHISKLSGLKRVKFLKEHCVSIPFPSGERQTDVLAMTCLPNGSILVADKQNNNVKLYSKQFTFKAIVQFNNRLADLCASNLCPVDIYVATQKHIFEITSMKKGLEVQRKIRVEIKRIEGITCWKYGIAVIHKKTNLTWEVNLMDYRGNSKSKLEIVNPFTQEIDDTPTCYITTTKGGKRVILTDTKNACMICTDVTSRCVLYETTLPENCTPSYVTSDNQHNVYVSCADKIQQLSKEGDNLGTVITKPEGVKSFGCILYNRSNDLLYVQTSRDTVRIYQMV